MNAHEFSEIMRRRRLELCGAVAVSLMFAVGAAKLAKPTYIAQANVLMVAEPPGHSDRTVTESPTKPILSDDLARLASSPKVISGVAKDLGFALDRHSYETVASLCGAKVRANSSVLELKCRARDERQAIDEANAFADEITSFYRTTATSRFTSLVADLRSQVDGRRNQMNALSGKISSIAARSPFAASASKDGSTLLTQYNQMLGEQQSLLQDLKGDRQTESISNQNLQSAKSLALHEIMSTDPLYSSAKNQYESDLARYNATKEKYRKSFPGAAEMRKILDNEQSFLAEQDDRIKRIPLTTSPSYYQQLVANNVTKSASAVDAAKLASVKENMRELQALMVHAKSDSVLLDGMTRDRDAAASAYSVLYGRLAEAQATEAEAGSVGSLIVMDRPLYASSPLLDNGNRLALFVFLSTIFIELLFIAGLEMYVPRRSGQPSLLTL